MAQRRDQVLGEIRPHVVDFVYLVDYDLYGNVVSDNATNIGLSLKSPKSNLDEEVIQRRGKRERRSNVVTRSMDPLYLATRKSPVKRTHRTCCDIIKMLVPSSPKTPSKTPTKKPRLSLPSPSSASSSSSSSPNIKTSRRKLVLPGNDSGISVSSPGSPNKSISTKKSPPRSPVSSSKNSKDRANHSSNLSPTKRKQQANSASTDRKRRSRRLSSLRRI